MKKLCVNLRAGVSLLALSVVLSCLFMPLPVQGDWLKVNSPPDVDKAFFGHPNAVRSCALATAANMLASVGYGAGTDMQAKANNIYTDLTTSPQYQSLVLNPGTGGAWIDTAIDYWLDHYNTDLANPYRYVDVRGFKNPKHPTDSDLPRDVGNRLRVCLPVGLSISWPVFGPTVGTGGHAITCWGDSGSADPLAGNPAQVFVTDSDLDFGGDVQTYTYDGYTNPNPGGANEGNGWYFNYSWWNSVNHPYIKHIATLHPVQNLPDQGGGKIVICKGAYELHQGNDISATDLHYTVWTDTQILSYKTSIDWPTNNPPTIVEVTRASGPPPHEYYTRGIEVTWDLSDNPVPYCTMVKITTEFVLKVKNGLLYEDVYFTHDADGWASAKKASISWKIFTPEFDPNDLPTNVTGGYVIGAFDVARAGDPSPIGEYRLIHEYAYDEDPEIHLFELAGDPEQVGESFVARNFRFGHSYGNLDETSLQEFEDWMTHIPDEVVLGLEPFSYELDWEDLLPYPEGEVHEGIPPVSLRLGFNEEITNNTGQDAYDFHLEGTLKSETFPQQVTDIFIAWPRGSIPGFDWKYDGGSITHVGGEYYNYSGKWSGSVPVPPDQQVHIGKAFNVNCANVFIRLRGWWTDRNGEKINPDAGTEVSPGVWVSDVPLLGFDIQDNIPARLTDPNLSQTVTLQNATDMEIEIVSPHLAVTDRHVPLEELVPDSNFLSDLDWRDIPSLPPSSIILPGESWTFDLREMDMVIPPDWTTVVRTEILDQVSGEYHFYAGKCQAHSAREPFDPGNEGLVAYYPLENDVLDVSGNELHGTIVGDPVFADGPDGYGMALDFDGVDDHVDCGNDTLFDITDAFTLSVWINWRATGATWQTVIAKGDNAWRLARGGDTQTMDFGFTAGGDRGWQAARTASEVPLSEWHHVTATYDTTDGAKIYLDGVLEGTNPDTGGITVGDYPLFIGDNSQQTGRFWDGLIDEVMIYNRVLSAGEILYLAGLRSEVENLVQNPSFEEDEAILDDPDWYQWVTWNPAEGAGSNATIVDTDAADGTKSLYIEPIGAENWHFIVLYMPIPTEVGTSYTTTFWAKAAEPRPLGAQYKATDNSVQWGYADFNLTTEWAEYSLTAEAQNAETKLEFFCAGVEVPLWLDAVSVCEE